LKTWIWNRTKIIGFATLFTFLSKLFSFLFINFLFELLTIVQRVKILCLFYCGHKHTSTTLFITPPTISASMLHFSYEHRNNRYSISALYDILYSVQYCTWGPIRAGLWIRIDFLKNLLNIKVKNLSSL
jgi:hypothetical protein